MAQKLSTLSFAQPCTAFLLRFESEYPKLSPKWPTPSSPRMFILSGYSEADKASISEFLKKNNVSCAPSSSMSFSARATHLVITKLSFSEKLLGSIASGRWVINYSEVNNSL